MNLLMYWPYALVLLVVVYFISGLNMVSEWHRHPVMRFGKYVSTLGPGITWLEPFTHKILSAIDVRNQVLSFVMNEGASLQTRDNVPIAFVTVLTMQIDAANVKKFTVGVTDGTTALKMKTLATVSEIVSGTILNDLLHQRTETCSKIQNVLQSRVLDWGINIIAVEIRDVKITDISIQEGMALKARAAKEAEAEMVRAEAQIAIAKELSQAANTLTPAGWELKRLETMLELCRSANNNTMIIPSDALSALAKVYNKS